jgi:putative FmdB family regulatory protein
MPIYEYVCPDCEVKFEKLRPMSDGNHADCPTCDTQAPRVLSLFAAFSSTDGGDPMAFAGGGCACAGGGGCACAGGF